jgi:hypothetical protein
MKYIKTYEDNKELNKIISRFIEVLPKFGFDYSSYGSYGNLSTEFFLDNVWKFTLATNVDVRPEQLKIYPHPYAIENQFMIDFLKSLDGLKLINSIDSIRFQTYTFEVVGNIDHIIIQITKENMEYFMSVGKYNL